MIGIFQGNSLRMFNTACDRGGDMEYAAAKELVQNGRYDYVLIDSDTRCPSFIKYVDPKRFRSILLGECRESPHGDESICVVHHVGFSQAKMIRRTKNKMTYLSRNGWLDPNYRPWYFKESDDVFRQKIKQIVDFIEERRILAIGGLTKGQLRIDQTAFVKSCFELVHVQLDLSQMSLLDCMIQNRCCLFFIPDGSGGVSSYKNYEGALAGAPSLRIIGELHWAAIANPLQCAYVALHNDKTSIENAVEELRRDATSGKLLSTLIRGRRLAAYMFEQRDYVRYLEAVICDHQKFIEIADDEDRFDSSTFQPFEEVNDPFIFS